MSRTPAEERLLDVVVATFDNSPDARMKEVLTNLIRHLHEFVSEVHLTRDEWFAGIKFLTAVGQKCDDVRQEFILLSDTLGVSSLVEMINYRGTEGSTENTVLGPFYVPRSPHYENGASIVIDDDAGERLRIHGTIRSTDGKPIAGAEIDVWQTATHGGYAVQEPGKQNPDNLRGIFTSAGDGSYEFWTVRPVVYSIPDDGPVGQMLEANNRHPNRAAHTHLMVRAPGYHTVATHVFDADSAYLDSDAVFGVRDSLVVKFEPQADGTLAAPFDVVLTPV